MSRTIPHRVTAILTAACICVGMNLPASSASPVLPIGEFTEPSLALTHASSPVASAATQQASVLAPQ